MLKRLLAVGAVAGGLVLTAVPRANADVGFSFGFGLPGFTYFQSYDPPVVYHPARPVEYDYSYAPRAHYGASSYDGSYGNWRYDRDEWRGDGGWRHGGWRDRWHGHRRDCGRRY